MEQQYHGLVVEGDHGRLGTVVGVDTDPATGATHLVVEGGDGTRRTLLSDMFTVRNNTVYVHDAAAFTTTTTTHAGAATQPLRSDVTELNVGEEVTIPVIREDLNVSVRQVEGGGVRVHKLVNERTETVEQPTMHDHVEVERVAIGRVLEGDQVPQARSEGDTLIIPILEEMLVVEKRLVLKEEVRITKRRTEDVEQVQVVLREETVEIEQIRDGRSTFDDPSVQA